MIDSHVRPLPRHRRHPRRAGLTGATAGALAAALLATVPGYAAGPAGDSSSATVAANITRIARTQLQTNKHNHEQGGYNCNYYTTALGLPGTGGSCSNGWHSEEWCADFGTWVWKHAHADVHRLTPAAASFAEYGKAHHTWHTAKPHVGDAAVFDLHGGSAGHVGLVTGVSGEKFTMISGNSSSSGKPPQNRVAKQTLSDGAASGFASPVAAGSSAQALAAAPAWAAGASDRRASGSTNRDWAQLLLRDGHWPRSEHNTAVVLQWMASEQGDIAHWWTGGNPDEDHINPLNDGNGTGGGTGLGSYSDLRKAARYAAKTVREGPDYRTVVTDLAASKPPKTTARAIWRSPWAGSHYGHGKAWHHGSVAAAEAPAHDW